MAFIEANGISFHYRLEGASGPTVIFLHEIGGSLDSWDGVVPDLAKRFRVFRYDQRGFGLSEKTRAHYSVDDLVGDVQALIGALNLQPPFHIVSLAASSMQALSFYKREPMNVGSLVFCNPAPGVDPSRADALNSVAAKAEGEGIRAIIPAMLDKSYPPTLGEPAAYEAYRGRYLANDPVGFGLAHRMLAMTNMIYMLPKVTVPTMVVAGKHDTVRPPAGTEELAKKIPGAKFALIEEAGHFLPTTGPKTLVKLLKDFLPK